MKEILREIVGESESPLKALNEMREYLQARVLAILQREGAMIPLAFHGGTALRFLYSLPRHSEDLDFTLERKPELYDLDSYLRAIEREFYQEGYEVEIKRSDERAVHSAWLRFVGLLFELGLSGQGTEIFSIKMEVDTNPPSGAGLKTSLVRRRVMLQLQHHDRASLLAGKLHAILQRPYTKGRDLYDLLWYLSDPGWPEPNLVLLNNALQQTDWDGPTLTEDIWRGIVSECIENLEWVKVRTDVTPFLERNEDLDFLTKENLVRVLWE
ncbi:MAG: nucleotidyl transferase AbiEii/AbiGii toxin family protein [Anaerolineales bacterium]|jgi:hypothetical protein